MPLADTAFVLDLLAGDPTAVQVMGLLEAGTAPVGVAPHTHFELYAGVGRSRRPHEETRRVEDALRAFVLFPFTAEAAKLAGLLDARLASNGTPLNLVDLMIGATAIQHGEPVVTPNRRDFERIPGLEVIGYDPGRP